MSALKRACIFERSCFASMIAPTCSARAENIAPASRFYFELRGIIKRGRRPAVNAEESNLTMADAIKILFAASISRESSLGMVPSWSSTRLSIDSRCHRLGKQKGTKFLWLPNTCLTCVSPRATHIYVLYIRTHEDTRSRLGTKWNDIFRSSSFIRCPRRLFAILITNRFIRRHGSVYAANSSRAPWMLPAFYRVEDTRNGTTLLSPFRSAMFPVIYKVPRREVPLFLSLKDWMFGSRLFLNNMLKHWIIHDRTWIKETA